MRLMMGGPHGKNMGSETGVLLEGTLNHSLGTLPRKEIGPSVGKGLKPDWGTPILLMIKLKHYLPGASDAGGKYIYVISFK